jgi:hypothetical protein
MGIIVMIISIIIYIYLPLIDNSIIFGLMYKPISRLSSVFISSI